MATARERDTTRTTDRPAPELCVPGPSSTQLLTGLYLCVLKAERFPISFSPSPPCSV